MKPRGPRAVIGTVALMAVVVTLLVIANWVTVRDHLEAWRFQLTRKTTALEPFTPTSSLTSTVWLPFSDTTPVGPGLLAAYSNRFVIYDEAARMGQTELLSPDANLTLEDVLRLLRQRGWRILDQRFPRKAFVFIGAPLITKGEE